MDEQRKYAILLAATILAARKLNDPDLKPWPRAAIIRDAISSANQILEEIDAKWPVRNSDHSKEKTPAIPNNDTSWLPRQDEVMCQSLAPSGRPSPEPHRVYEKHGCPFRLGGPAESRTFGQVRK